jgi:hypothetical protein
LGERLLCKQEVIGSIPFTSTTGRHHRRTAGSPCGRRSAAALKAAGGAERAPAGAFGEARNTVPGAAWHSRAGVLIEG